MYKITIYRKNIEKSKNDISEVNAKYSRWNKMLE